jgi:hypothetical protein
LRPLWSRGIERHARACGGLAPVRRSTYRAAALAILLLAAALRFWAIDSGLPHPLTRPDEEVVIAQTKAPASGNYDVQWAIYPSAYIYLTWLWGAAGLRAGRLLGVFPPASYLTTLTDDPARIILVDRVLSAAAGTATVALVMAVARRAFGPRAGLAAGLLLATSFLHARDSHAVKPDVLFGFGVVASLWAIVPLARRATLGRAAVAGGAVGLTLATKYPAVLLCAPAYVAAVMGSRARGWRRIVPLSAIVVGLVAAGVFLATSPFLVLNSQSRQNILYLLHTLLPQNVPGVITAAPPTRRWWEGFTYHALFSLRWGAGLLQTLLLPVAIAWGLWRRRPIPLLAALFALVYYGVLGTSTVNLARYMTPLLPVLALLEAGLLAVATRRIGRRAVFAVALALLVAEPLARAVAFDRIAARTDTRVEATRWMAEHLPADANVEVIGTQIWVYGRPQMPPGMTARQLKPDLETLRQAGIRWVLTHDHPLPFSRVPPEVMAALAPHLRLLAEFDPFTAARDEAVFEPADAYYIPFHGFAGVRRPGPLIRIYELG